MMHRGGRGEVRRADGEGEEIEKYLRVSRPFLVSCFLLLENTIKCPTGVEPCTFKNIKPPAELMPLFIHRPNHSISAPSGSCKCLNREVCLIIVKTPWGIWKLIPVNLRNAAALCPSFLGGNKISFSLAQPHSLPASLLLFPDFYFFFLPVLSTLLHISFICFPLQLKPKVLALTFFHKCLLPHFSCWPLRIWSQTP